MKYILHMADDQDLTVKVSVWSLFSNAQSINHQKISKSLGDMPLIFQAVRKSFYKFSFGCLFAEFDIKERPPKLLNLPMLLRD